MTQESAGYTLTKFSVDHTRLRLTNRSVAGLGFEADCAKWSQSDTGALFGAGKLAPHRNWLRRADYLLPPRRFSRGAASCETNLVDLVSEAARRLAVDGIAIVRPIGSVTYARVGGVLNWDLVRDLDVWVFVSAKTVASGVWRELHSRLQRYVFDVLVEHQVRAELDDHTGYVYLCDVDGTRRMVELKLANLDWLHEGYRHVHLRRTGMLRLPQPAHFDVPRLEWAAYTPYENYYPSAEAKGPFEDAVTSVSVAAAICGFRYAYGENLAEAFRVLTPRRTFRAIRSRRFFTRDVGRVLKKKLMLAVMLRNDPARCLAMRELETLRDGDRVGLDLRSRTRYLAECTAILQLLRDVDPQVFCAWIMDDSETSKFRFPRWPDQVDVRETLNLDAWTNVGSGNLIAVGRDSG